MMMMVITMIRPRTVKVSTHCSGDQRYALVPPPRIAGRAMIICPHLSCHMLIKLHDKWYMRAHAAYESGDELVPDKLILRRRKTEEKNNLKP
mmetsp:Transcript_7472/g.11868  ORF Transcript_7472/g.11868 Transcript_7472/m.11868 type:complete len:92 (-) Transcript_7472:185-460(-)